MKKNIKTVGRLIVSDSSSADMFFASGFNAPDDFIYFSVGRRKAVVVSSMEYQRALSEAKQGVEVYTYNNFTTQKNSSIEHLLPLISQKYKIKEWIVPFYFPVGYANILKKHGITVTPISGSFFTERRTKGEDEIAKIKQSLEIAEKGMQKALNILKESRIDRKTENLIWKDTVLTSERLIREIEIEVFKYNAVATNTIVSCGPQSSEPHNSGSGPVKANQPIVIDIFPRHVKTGFWGDITRTFVKGKINDKIRQAYDAVLAAKEHVINIAEIAMPCSKLHKEALNILQKHGFKTGKKVLKNNKIVYYGFIHGLGHGVGLDIHELPRVSPSSRQRLKEGDVFTIEPGLYYPEWGGIRIEDMAAIKNNKLIRLTSFQNIINC